MRVEDLLEALDALKPEDFNLEHGMDVTESVCTQLEAIGDADIWLERMFHFLERLDGVDLGSPGPVVHLIESCGDQYHPFLIESIHRKPTPLTVWMVSRAANADPNARNFWRGLLEEIMDREDVSKEAAAEASEFLE
jgi:hypothetical protein